MFPVDIVTDSVVNSDISYGVVTDNVVNSDVSCGRCD